MKLLNKKKVSTFLAYSDESGIFDKRYQAIGVVSGERGDLLALQSELKQFLKDKGVKEIKWEEVRTHRPKIEVANLFIQKAVEFAVKGLIRIDVLLWDMYDERHSIPGRDNQANLERMYYKVLRHISERWEEIHWELYPDENSAINWLEIQSYLNQTKFPRHNLPGLIALFQQEQYKINFLKIEQLNSKNKPLIQLADLFAGMTRFSREKGSECVKWLNLQKRKNQLLLFEYEEQEEAEDPTKVDRNRFILIGNFNDLCKEYRLGVSLDTRKYLWTPMPKNPINFWNYEPQHDQDKAPTKK
jgi:hypothetical protein